MRKYVVAQTVLAHFRFWQKSVSVGRTYPVKADAQSGIGKLSFGGGQRNPATASTAANE
jgi:hypothetical protein